MNEFKIKNGLLVSGSITGVTESGSDNSAKMASTSWVRTFVGATANGSLKSSQSFTATAGQTTFIVSGGYGVGLIDVFVNGSYLNSDSYTASNGTTVVLTDAASLGDILDVIIYSSLSQGFVVTSDQIGEGAINKYYTDARAREAISLTTTGTSGAATYNSTTGVLNIPQYQGGVTSFNTRTGAITLSSSDVTTALTYTPVTNARTLTINGVTYDLSADRSWSIAADVTSFNTRTGAISLTSTDVTNALEFTPENAANKGVNNGYASLDSGGKIPASQLPSYVDDILEYTNLAGFPGTGEAGKIYVDLTENKIYRWSGSAYIEVSPTVGGTWGAITGTLSNQTDLQTALNAKQASLSGTGFVKISGTTISYDNTAYVPYNGATSGIQLGSYGVFGGYVYLAKTGSIGGGLYFEHATSINAASAGYTSVNAYGTNGIGFFFGGFTKGIILKNNLLTTYREYSLPDASGTLALASDLSSYVPTSRTLTINGTAFDLSANRSWTIAPSSAARVEQTFTATASQTTFTITGGYVVGLVDVFVNGVKYPPSDFTATNGTTVVLGVACVAGDIVSILNYTATVAALPTSRDVLDYTATAGQTIFTVSGGYTVGLLDVFVNGAKLTSSEFTATNGTTFVLTFASAVGDQVQAIRYNASVTGVSGSGTANYVPKFTASGTVANSGLYDSGTGFYGFNTTSVNAGANGGGITINGTNNSVITLQNAGVNKMQFYHSVAYGTVLYGYENVTIGANTDLALGGYQGDGIKITSNGQILMGPGGPSFLPVDDGVTLLQLNGAIKAGAANLAGPIDYTPLTVRNLNDGNYYVGINFESGTDKATSAIRSYRTNSSVDYQTALTFWTKGTGAGPTTPTERMRIDSSGRIGIATTSPDTTLQLGRVFGFMHDINSGYIDCNRTSSGNYIVSQYAARIHLDSALGEIKFLTAVSGTAGSSASLVERFRITQSGAGVFSSSVTATSIIRTGGTSSQFLKADGSVDSTTYAPNTFYAIDMLIVGGGGGGGGAEMSNGYGGGGAGGGAGGYLAGASAVTSGSTYSVVIGAGGAGGISRLAADGGGLPGSNGAFSSAFGLVSIGGGQGQGEESNTTGASNGGSGGGKGGDSGSYPVGVATPGQGNNGGSNGSTRSGGGGGGANTTGGTAVPGSRGGLGGNGLSWFNGVVYACGGGGGGGAGVVDNAAGGNNSVNGGRGSRSTGGGGTTGEGGENATAGNPNTGTGGGAAGAGYLQGGQNGGSGIVIIRYAGAQRGTGGTVTSSGGFTYHTFTSSGTFTA